MHNYIDVRKKMLRAQVSNIEMSFCEYIFMTFQNSEKNIKSIGFIGFMG